jgi:hypothetical protein
MKAVEVELEKYLDEIKGRPAWRVRLGYGGFLTFDFGTRLTVGRHYRGSWHLWIYQANWSLRNGDRELANLDSPRQKISLAVERLEKVALRAVQFDPHTSVTTFQFGSFQLLVKPADYLEEPDSQDDYWRLYLPDNNVLRVGPGGVQLTPATSQA